MKLDKLKYGALFSAAMLIGGAGCPKTPEKKCDRKNIWISAEVNNRIRCNELKGKERDHCNELKRKIRKAAKAACLTVEKRKIIKCKYTPKGNLECEEKKSKSK